MFDALNTFFISTADFNSAVRAIHRVSTLIVAVSFAFYFLFLSFGIERIEKKFDTTLPKPVAIILSIVVSVLFYHLLSRFLIFRNVS